MVPNFEWHEEKAEANLKNHGVSFDEVTTDSVVRFQLGFPTLTIRRISNGMLTSAVRIGAESW